MGYIYCATLIILQYFLYFHVTKKSSTFKTTFNIQFDHNIKFLGGNLFVSIILVSLSLHLTDRSSCIAHVTI